MTQPKIKIFYDVETTGLDPANFSMHQLAGFIEIDGEIKDKFNIKMRPQLGKQISEDALAVCGITHEELISRDKSQKDGYEIFRALLQTYIDPFNKMDKAWLIGYNNRRFDDSFLRTFFEYHGDKYFGSWFWSDTQDVMVLASTYLEDRRRLMPNFKLKSTALELGIPVKEESLHDAYYDVHLTREIYRIVTGLEIEL